MSDALFYDADCGFCTRSAEFLRARGARCEVRPQREHELLERGVDPVRAAREVPFVAAAGGVRWGADAIAAALATCPGAWGLLGRLIGTPPALLLGRPVYAWVAAHRHRLPGGSATCRL